MLLDDTVVITTFFYSKRENMSKVYMANETLEKNTEFSGKEFLPLGLQILTTVIRFAKTQ